MAIIHQVRVSNMTSLRSNREVPNQFIIETGFGTYFQSYKSIIAYIPNAQQRANGCKITLDKNYWDYSTTTGKYRNEFLREGIAETRRKIASGDYALEDLNEAWKGPYRSSPHSGCSYDHDHGDGSNCLIHN